MIKWNRNIILWMFCIYSLSLPAQEIINDSLKSKWLSEIAVNAPFYIYSVKEWPGAISKIDSLQLKSGDGYDIADALNKIPGVFMQQGTLSTNRITIRGIGSRTPYNSNRIKAYWGNVSLTDGDGVTSIEDLGLNDIMDIQVVKGPSSALYGAGLGGVIVINDQTLSEGKDHLLVRSQAESFSTFLQQVNVGTTISLSGHMLASFQDLRSSGWRDNSNYKRDNLTLRWKTKFGNKHLDLLYHYRFLDGEIPSSLDSTDFYSNPRKAADSWAKIGGFEKSDKHILGVNYNVPASSSAIYKLGLFVQRNKMEELRPFNRLLEDRVSLGTKQSFVWQNYKIKNTFGLEVLWEVNNQRLKSVDEEDFGTLISDVKSDYRSFNFFEMMDFNFNPRLLIQLSLHLNKTLYKADKDDLDYNMIFSPKVAFNYKISGINTVYGSVGHGFSMPSYEELTGSDGYINPNIKPEEGWGAEIGYRYSDTKRRAFIDITVYYMFLHHLLVTKRVNEDVFYGINAGKTEHMGMELMFKYPMLVINSTRRVDISLSYFKSLHRFVTFIDDGMDYGGNQLPGIPDSNLSMELFFLFRSFGFNVLYNRVGEMFMNDSNTKNYEGYNRLDLKVNKDLRVRNMTANLYLGVTNVLNCHYASMILINATGFGNNQARYYYPGKPLSVYGGVIVKINSFFK